MSEIIFVIFSFCVDVKYGKSKLNIIIIIKLKLIIF